MGRFGRHVKQLLDVTIADAKCEDADALVAQSLTIQSINQSIINRQNEMNNKRRQEILWPLVEGLHRLNTRP